MSKILMHSKFSVIVLVMLTVLILTLPAQVTPFASTQTAIIVDTLQDEDNVDGDCSLREAIQATIKNISVDNCPAGSLGDIDTIYFSTSGTITLASPLIVTAGGPLLIDGENEITISGDGSVGIFDIKSGSDLTLESLTLVDGYVNAGGGILNAGTLLVNDCTLSNNHATYGGGGIYNLGVVTVTSSTFNNNSSVEGGGAIHSYHGTATITHSILSNNSSRYGGGILSGNTMTITFSIIAGNTATVSGGGIDDNGTLDIANSTLTGNSAPEGGGLMNWGFGTLNIKKSTFLNNSANLGGGIYNGGPLEITNSTFSNNSAVNYGGGIDNYATLILINSTLANNSAGVEGGGIYNGPGYGIAESINSIIAYSSAGGNCAGDPITDGGHNIEETNTCGFLAVNGSLPNTDPQLSPLQRDFGPTMTHALLVGSLAIDHADPANCPDTDQRGIIRPIDGDDNGSLICDIGAYEFVVITNQYLPLTSR